MLPQTKLGRTRVRLLEMSARDFAEQCRKHGCTRMTIRRLRGIESGELQASEKERQVIASLLGIHAWEVLPR